MRSTQNSALKMVLIFTPLIAIPLLAIFGIPEFPSVSASPSQDRLELQGDDLKDPGIGQSEIPTQLDLFQPLTDENGGARPQLKQVQENGWKDPFTSKGNGSQNSHAGQVQRSGSWVPPQAALTGWEIDNPAPGATVDLQETSINAQVPAPREGFLPTQPVPQNTVENFQPQTPNIQRRDLNPLPEQWPQQQQPAQPPEHQQQFVQEQAAPRQVAQVPQQEQPFAPKSSQPAPFPDEADQPKQQIVASPAQEPAPQPAQPLTWREASERLNAMGIKNYHLAPPNRQGEGYYFSCFVTPPNNPRITHRFEAEAGDPLQAVQRVLAQVEAWQKRQ